jgi:hypothetical protein
LKSSGGKDKTNAGFAISSVGFAKSRAGICNPTEEKTKATLDLPFPRWDFSAEPGHWQ